MAEFWDAYDSDFNKIQGLTLVRGKEMPNGTFHLVSDVILKHSDGTFLIMQRDKRKSDPLKWEASAGGSALMGETAFQCAKRELYEETGIEVEKIEEIGRIIDEEKHCIFVEFFAETDTDKQKIVLQEGETVAFKWISKKELLSMKELSTYRIQKFL